MAKNKQIMRLSKTLAHPGFWLRYVSIPLVVSALYCRIFVWLLNFRDLPAGVNLAFAEALWPALLALGTLAGLASLLLQRTTRTKAVSQPAFASQKLDILLVFLPLAPILQYVVINRAQLTFADILLLFSIFSAAALIFIMLIPTLLAPFADPGVLRILGLVLTFMLANMAGVSAAFNWYQHGDLTVQLLILCAVLTLVACLYFSARRQLLVILVIGFFVSGAFVQPRSSSPQVDEIIGIRQHPLFAQLAGQKPAQTPNVYLLIYDAYVSNETMLQYGIDNQAQEDYLVQQGFQLYPHTYSIGAYSLATMSPVLNASTNFFGNTRSGTSGAGVVQAAFQDLGYTTYGYFGDDYFYRAIGSSYDVTFPGSRPVSSLLLDGILLGEFRFDLGFDQSTANELVERKHELFSNIPASPILLYSHTFKPGHSQNSGVCLENETELFAQRLEEANQEMRFDLETLIQNDPTAIIIVAGDHGPYLSKNCFSTSEGGYSLREITRYDIQDRFGTFLAIRWPDGQVRSNDEIIVLQDIFPAVFAYLFDDPVFLDLRVPPVTIYEPSLISGAIVDDGTIHGGVNDGEPLFESPLP